MVRALPVVLSVLILSCAGTAVPAMQPGTVGADAMRGAIVFVRPSSRCDTIDHARVVDADGHFVGALGPKTWFAAPVTPGEHVFYVWPGFDLRNDAHPEIRPVGVLRVVASEGRSTVIAVRVFEPAMHRCSKYAVFHFTRAAEAEASEWMQDARELVPDHTAGEALLARDADVTKAYLAIGKERLERRDAEP